MSSASVAGGSATESYSSEKKDRDSDSTIEDGAKVNILVVFIDFNKGISRVGEKMKEKIQWRILGHLLPDFLEVIWNNLFYFVSLKNFDITIPFIFKI